MRYRGYRARVDYDSQDKVFAGRIVGIADVIGFHADTVETLERAFHEAVDDYLETCAAIGKSPDKPYSGNLMLRIDPELHREAAVSAELRGSSLNQLVEQALKDRLAHSG
jgi:predicted HicB family RNase H-like nuclease